MESLGPRVIYLGVVLTRIIITTVAVTLDQTKFARSLKRGFRWRVVGKL